MELKQSPEIESFISNLIAMYQLSDIMDMEGFLISQIKNQAIICNLNNLTLASIGGQKEVYYKIKVIVKDQFNKFFKAHDELVEEMFKENNKDKH